MTGVGIKLRSHTLISKAAKTLSFSRSPCFVSSKSCNDYKCRPYLCKRTFREKESFVVKMYRRSSEYSSGCQRTFHWTNFRNQFHIRKHLCHCLGCGNCAIENLTAPYYTVQTSLMELFSNWDKDWKEANVSFWWEFGADNSQNFTEFEADNAEIFFQNFRISGFKVENAQNFSSHLAHPHPSSGNFFLHCDSHLFTAFWT